MVAEGGAPGRPEVWLPRAKEPAELVQGVHVVRRQVSADAESLLDVLLDLKVKMALFNK